MYDMVDACSVRLFVIRIGALRFKSYYTENQISLHLSLVNDWQLCKRIVVFCVCLHSGVTFAVYRV